MLNAENCKELRNVEYRQGYRSTEKENTDYLRMLHGVMAMKHGNDIWIIRNIAKKLKAQQQGEIIAGGLMFNNIMRGLRNNVP